MFEYTSYLSQSPPASLASASKARAAFEAPSPYSAYGPAHNDIMRASGRENAALFDLASSKANTDFSLQEQQARNQLALAGLQQMGQQQDYERQLANSRLTAVNGIFNSLLGGLYQ